MPYQKRKTKGGRAKGKSAAGGSRRRESDAETDTDSDAFDGGASSRGGMGPSPFKSRREQLDLNLVIAQEEIEASKTSTPCWTTCRAGPSTIPPRPMCVICGFAGKYRCRSCSSHKTTAVQRYVCSSRCGALHKESDCGKTIRWLSWL